METSGVKVTALRRGKICHTREIEMDRVSGTVGLDEGSESVGKAREMTTIFVDWRVHNSLRGIQRRVNVVDVARAESMSTPMVGKQISALVLSSPFRLVAHPPASPCTWL
jgi:hypothetical protein